MHAYIYDCEHMNVYYIYIYLNAYKHICIYEHIATSI